MIELPLARDVDRRRRLDPARWPSDHPLRGVDIFAMRIRGYTVTISVEPVGDSFYRLMWAAAEGWAEPWPRLVAPASDQQVGLFVRQCFPRSEC